MPEIGLCLTLLQGMDRGCLQCTSIIVFYCGNFERIGIRHRESQTLYLSPIIDPARCELAYGKMHVGLSIAAYQDTLDRFEQLRASDGAKSRPPDSSRSAKRPVADDKAPKKRSRRKVSPDDKSPDVNDTIPEPEVCLKFPRLCELTIVTLEPF